MNIQPSIDGIEFGLHMEVASIKVIEEMMPEAFTPGSKYNSATMGTHTHPSSECLGSLVWCFLASVTWTAVLANTSASKRVGVFSGVTGVW